MFHQGDAGIIGVIQAHSDIQFDEPELPFWATPDNTTEAGMRDEEAGKLPSQRMCAPQLLHLDLDQKPLWFNGGLVRNKFVPRRDRKFESFESYLIEPRDIREPGAWFLGEGNMCCLTTDNHLKGDLTGAEKELLNEMFKQARIVGIGH